MLIMFICACLLSGFLTDEIVTHDNRHEKIKVTEQSRDMYHVTTMVY